MDIEREIYIQRDRQRCRQEDIQGQCYRERWAGRETSRERESSRETDRDKGSETEREMDAYSQNIQ